ncbi:hypothetical protein GQ53DRAFT_800793 [Thozetella sp. PMI_491]|nr:hypothetical protein GQ53DRAFT_800793 [Thozetella sp. PMI_491]
MHPLLVSVAAFALAGPAAGHAGSAQSADLDGSVWKSLSKASARSTYKAMSNRPAKRQEGWSPPSGLVTPLKEVWDHCDATYSDIFGFKNYGWDQIMATQGSINACVRWDSNATVTEAQRTQIASVLSTQYQKWFTWLYGFDNFPFADISVNVVGWAVHDKSLLEGSTTGITVCTDVDASGVPECAPACGRYYHTDGDYSTCAAGNEGHYDQSLWLTDGLDGGFGGDWGQQIGREYMMDNLESENIHILLHEMGHTFGLDDFYDWTPTGVTNFIMLAGSSTVITDFDGWMLRNWWYELSRQRGWQTGSSTAATSATASTGLLRSASSVLSKTTLASTRSQAPRTSAVLVETGANAVSEGLPTSVSPGPGSGRQGKCSQ